MTENTAVVATDTAADKEMELYAGDDKVWHSCDVTTMFAAGTDIDAVMGDAQDILNVNIEYAIETIPDNDWVNVVMDSFVPIKVGEGLWIVPEWAKTLPAGEEDGLAEGLEPRVELAAYHPVRALVQVVDLGARLADSLQRPEAVVHLEPAASKGGRPAALEKVGLRCGQRGVGQGD